MSCRLLLCAFVASKTLGGGKAPRISDGPYAGDGSVAPGRRGIVVCVDDEGLPCLVRARGSPRNNVS